MVWERRLHHQSLLLGVSSAEKGGPGDNDWRLIVTDGFEHAAPELTRFAHFIQALPFAVLEYLAPVEK